MINESKRPYKNNRIANQVTMNRTRSLTLVAAFAASLSFSAAFVPFTTSNRMQVFVHHSSSSTPATTSFIENELRGAAMRLHTRQQAPKEGEAPAKKMEPYTPTRADYLQFLIDSQHVYEALESVVNERPELEVYRNTGLERVSSLETDITFMCNEYGLKRTEVGQPGKKYAEMIRGIQSIPEFMCHYYNFYFAHTAGGRMIGKQMSALLLDKKTLEFYKVCSRILLQLLPVELPSLV